MFHLVIGEVPKVTVMTADFYNSPGCDICAKENVPIFHKTFLDFLLKDFSLFKNVDHVVGINNPVPKMYDTPFEMVAFAENTKFS